MERITRGSHGPRIGTHLCRIAFASMIGVWLAPPPAIAQGPATEELVFSFVASPTGTLPLNSALDAIDLSSGVRRPLIDAPPPGICRRGRTADAAGSLYFGTDRANGLDLRRQRASGQIETVASLVNVPGGDSFSEFYTCENLDLAINPMTNELVFSYASTETGSAFLKGAIDAIDLSTGARRPVARAPVVMSRDPLTGAPTDVGDLCDQGLTTDASGNVYFASVRADGLELRRRSASGQETRLAVLINGPLAFYGCANLDLEINPLSGELLFKFAGAETASQFFTGRIDALVPGGARRPLVRAQILPGGDPFEEIGDLCWMGLASNRNGDTFFATQRKDGLALMRASISGATSTVLALDDVMGIDVPRALYNCFNLDLTLRTPPPEVRAIEVTQVVQTWTNDVPLLQGKATFARVHIQDRALPGVLKFHPNPPGVCLRAFDSSGKEIDGPISPLVGGVFTRSAENVRTELAASATFHLPDAWTRRADAVSLVAQGTPPGVPCSRLKQLAGPAVAGFGLGCNDPAEPGGTSGDCVVSVVFQPPPRPDFELVRIVFSGKVGAATLDDADEQLHRLRAMYPFAEAKRTKSLLMVSGNPPRSESESRALLKRLIAERVQQGGCIPLFCGKILYGFYRDAAFPGGVAGIATRAMAGVGLVRKRTQSAFVAGHEVAHILGVRHAVSGKVFPLPNGQKGGACGEAPEASSVPDFPDFSFFGPVGLRPTLGPLDAGPDAEAFGFDSLLFPRKAGEPSPVIDPRQTFELMGYCRGVVSDDTWTSVSTYESLLGELQASFPTVGNSSATTSQRVFYGTVEDDGSVELEAPVRSVVSSSAAAASGDFRLDVLDAQGQVLGSRRFSPVPTIIDPGGPPRAGLFVVPMEDRPGVVGARISRGGVPVAEIQASPNPPQVTVVAPNGGERLGNGPIVVRWRGSDADGDPLTYAVQVSTDDGQTWSTVTALLEAETLTLPPDAMGGTDRGRVRVVASDGFLDASDGSDAPFLVSNRPPLARIVRPSSGVLLVGEQQLELEGEASDLEDDAAALSTQFVSSIDGALGPGPRLLVPRSSLSDGTHTLSFRVTDSAGATAEDSISLRVEAEGADSDLDRIPDAIDNCPVFINPFQEDTGGVAGLEDPTGRQPDGIGDACQCGDNSDDGVVDLVDVVALARAFAGLPGPFAPEKCSIDSDPVCGGGDLQGLRAQLVAPTPSVAQTCQAANP